MNFKKDVIDLPKEFAFDFYEGNGRMMNDSTLHFHDCLEINYVEMGSGINIIENKEYVLRPGDFYIINNLERHFAFTDSYLKMKVIVFDPDFVWHNQPFDYEYISPFYQRSIHFCNCVKKEDLQNVELLSIIREIENEWNAHQEGYKIIIKALLMKMLAIIYRHYKSNDEMDENVSTFYKTYDKIRYAIAYINENYNQELSLDQLAKISFMSKNYFSSFFKKVMGMTVSEYIERMRINAACRLLKTTDKKVIEIGADCGYNNVTHFNRMFMQHIQLTPSQYRINYVKKGL